MAYLLSPANVMKEGGTIDVGRYELVKNLRESRLRRCRVYARLFDISEVTVVSLLKLFLN